MKLRYIFTSLLATLGLMLTGCTEEADTYLKEVKVSSSYISIPAAGTEESGPVEIHITTQGAWTIEEVPEWLTVDPLSGRPGESKIKFSAEAATESREATLKLQCLDKTQLINVIQMTEKVDPVVLSVAEALQVIAPLGSGEVAPGTFRVKGIVCKINEISVQYGNATYYLSDDGSFSTNNWLQVYRGKWLNDSAFTSGDEFAIGDELVIEGSLMNYNGTPETKEKTAYVVSISKSLIGISSVELLGLEEEGAGVGVTEFPQEGGDIKVGISSKGNGFHVSIPEAAKSWLHIEDFGGDYVTLHADANTGGDRKVEVSFSTDKDGQKYTCAQNFSQKGAILEVSVADFIAAAETDTQYRLSGVVTRGYSSDTSGESFYVKDWSGEVLVYKLTGFKASGAVIGDVITVVGKRSSFRGTPQMGSGVYESHIATVKDKTLAQIAAAADDPNVYYIATGTIKEIVNATYGNVTLEDESGSLYVYGCYPGWGAAGDNRKNFLETAGIKVGDKLSVIGVKATKNNAPQISNGIYYAHESMEDTSISVSEAIALEDNAAVELKESVVAALTTKGAVLSDGTSAIYAYSADIAAYSVGDKVTLKAVKTTYNGVPELTELSRITKVSEGNEVTYPEAKDITATAAEYAATVAEYVSISGTLSVNNGKYNITIDGIDAETKQGSIVYPVNALNADSFDGKKITVTGYFNGLSGNGKYINVIATGIEEADDGTGSGLPDYDPVTGFTW